MPTIGTTASPAPNSTYRALPASSDPKFNAGVKETIEILTGLRGDNLDRAVTLRDLTDALTIRYLNDKIVSVTVSETVPTGDTPQAPTGLTTLQANDSLDPVFCDHLIWTAPSDPLISHYEIWSHTSNDRASGSIVGYVGHNQNHFERINPDPTDDRYYWVRSKGTNGVYSDFEPASTTAGVEVLGTTGIKSAIDRILDALRCETPATYNAGTTYNTGDQVKYACTDGVTRVYQSKTDSNTGNTPEGDTVNWLRIGIMGTGTLDGTAGNGIDGNVILDDSILAEALVISSTFFQVNGSNELDITDLTGWIAGTANQITVTDDGDHTVTLSTPQNIDTGASPTFAGFTQIGDATNKMAVASDGEISLHGTARVWNASESFFGYALMNGSTPPTLGTLGDYNFVTYTIGDDTFISCTVPATWEIGEDIYLRIRWAINEAYATNSGEVRWRVDWSATPNDTEPVDAPTHSGYVESDDINIPAVAKHVVQTTLTIPATNIVGGDALGLKVSRIAIGGGNNPTAEPGVLYMRLVYKSDRLGIATT